MKQINSFKKDGIQKFLSGEYESAITSFTKAIEINPSDFEAYWKRGVAKSRLEKYESANDDFVKSNHYREKFNEVEDLKNKQAGLIAQWKKGKGHLDNEEDQINNADEVRCGEGDYVFMADRISLMFTNILNLKLEKSQDEKNLYLKLLKNKDGKDKESLEGEYIESRRNISNLAFLRYFYRDFCNSLANLIKSSSYDYALIIFCKRILISTYYFNFDSKLDSIEIPSVKSDLILKLQDFLLKGENNWVKSGFSKVRVCNNEIINELIKNDMDELEKNDPDAYLNQYEIKPSINPFDKGHPFLERSSLSRNDFKFWKREHFFRNFDYEKFKLIVHSSFDYAVDKELSFWVKDIALMDF